ncbi:NmrA family NAD(P)-binding protein [Pseudarthrobacter sp. NamE2]|uniref:NmrA family NAD(P)-binding protein n=1 Tax=Pseudarthrobacter sp. NamE2 TaxID=2576838 RepID=UPI001F0D6C0A
MVGGTGMLGGQVAAAFVDRGKKVRALIRPGSDHNSSGGTILTNTYRQQRILDGDPFFVAFIN